MRLRPVIVFCLCALVVGCFARDKAEQRDAEGRTLLPSELAGFRAQIEKTKLDCIHIKAERRNNTEPWASKLRGTPYLPKGTAYPRDPDGNPLHLLIQLNFGEMPPLDGYPSSGILQLFISGLPATYMGEPMEAYWGAIVYDEEPFNDDRYFASLQDQRYFRVLYHPNVVMDREQLEKPPWILPVPLLPVMDEAALTFEKSYEYVGVDDYQFEKVFGQDSWNFFSQFGDKQEDVYYGYASFSEGWPTDKEKWPIGRIGGYASFVQGDPRSNRPDEDWLLLLQLESSGVLDDGLQIMWGDLGVGGLFIRRADLQKSDFAKVAYYWDNH